jgi:hypothetical protein
MTHEDGRERPGVDPPAPSGRSRPSSLIKRRYDWRARLADTIEAQRRRPFTGDYNCAIFAADCVCAMTGVDLAAPYRGMSFDAAVAAMQANGYPDLCALVAAHLPEIAPAFARAGDVAAFAVSSGDIAREDGRERPGAGWAIGIVNGERVTVLRQEGLGTLLLTQVLRAFQVPG